MIGILVGTNYFFQATFDGVMPHNILFTINCFIIWLTIKWHKNRNLKNMFFLALVLAFATLCRPTELLWVLVPLFWNVLSFKDFIEKITYLFKNFLQIILFISTFFVILFIQLAYNKYASGDYIQVNLHSEGFSFLSPYIIEFLFSYKKGWLLYTPIMIISIIGFYFLFKEKKKIWLPTFSFFIISLYVTSSWECWWYATSFSQRPMVETYAMMLFPFGSFLSWQVKQKILIKYSLYVLLFTLICFNLFQTWQFNKGILHGERMTKNYYWQVFGATKPNKKFQKYLSVDKLSTKFTNKDNYYKKEVFFSDFETQTNNTIDTTYISSNKSFLLDSETRFSPSLMVRYKDITHKSHLWINASVWVYLTTPYQKSNSCVVVSVESKGKSYKYKCSTYNNTNIKLFEWTKIELEFLTPYIRYEDDVIKSYFWNMGGSPVLIDNFKVDVYEPKIDYK